MNSLPRYCLDTHTLVWYFTGSKSLSVRAFNIIEEIFNNKAEAYISLIVILEVYFLSLKKSDFKFKRFLKYLNRENIYLIPIDVVVVKEAFILNKELEMHDRIIIATALVNNCPVVSKDKLIHKSKNVETIW